MFGDYGGMGFSIFEIDEYGTMTISDLSSQQVLEKYRLGDVNQLILNDKLLPFF